MSHSPLARERLARFRPERSTLLWGAVVLNAELLAVLLYVAQPSVTPTGFRYYVYPFVWINVGLWALWRTRPRATNRRRKLLVGGLAVAYFGVLAYAGGLVGPGMGSMATGFRLAPLPPGLGPALVYSGASVQFALLPYKVVGYVALAYLVYATALDVSGSAVSGILGLFSCVSCTWPVIASLVSGVAGSSSAVAGAALTSSYGLSTVVFVVTVGLLYWRPFGDR